MSSHKDSKATATGDQGRANSKTGGPSVAPSTLPSSSSSSSSTMKAKLKDLLPYAIFAWMCDVVRIVYYLACDLKHVAKHFWRVMKKTGGSYTQNRPITRPDQLVHDPSRKVVIIVGGSFAGVSAATQLSTDPKFEVILIEPKDYFEYTPGILRAMVAPHHHPELVSPLKFDNVQVVQGWAGDVTPFTVTVRPTPPLNEGSEQLLEAGASIDSFTIKYDYLVLAHGTTYAAPIKALKAPEFHLPVRSAQMRKVAMELANKRKATIVGAGLVGVELAAEIAVVMPQVKVTLHSALPTILPGMDKRVIDYCHNFLVKNGVEIQLSSNFNLSNYQPQEDEAYYPCVGVVPSTLTLHDSLIEQIAENEKLRLELEKSRHKQGSSCYESITRTCLEPNNSPVAGSVPPIQQSMANRLVVENPSPSALTYDEVKKRGAELDVMLQNARIKAQTSQQVKGLPNVFAVGDCALYSINMPQMAFTAEAEGHAVASSIANLESNKPPVEFPQGHFHCDTPPALCCVSLGPYNGVIIFNQILIFGRLAAYGKDFIEFSKVASVRQKTVAQMIWAVGDPTAFAASAAYNATIERFKGTSIVEWISFGACAAMGSFWTLNRFFGKNNV